jgi:monovalent cation:H+ antiporter-2, CPA2 family
VTGAHQKDYDPDVHDLDLIVTLAGGLSAALVLGYVTQRARLSPIVGYLLAGLLVGPYTPGFVADSAIAEQLAEVGVILLMFGVGLQFRIDELIAVRRVAVPGAILQSAVATGLGALIARAIGWSWSAGIVFGMALSVASTVVLVRILVDNRELHTQTGHIAVGWLVVEDLFTVVAVVLLPVLFMSGGTPGSLAVALGVTMLKVAALLIFTIVFGNRAVPRALDHVAATGSRELFTLTVLVLALGIAVGSSLVFGVSMALGAFLAGLVVGRSEYSLRAASEAIPMRDAFAVLFFVSVGMLLDPRSIVQTPGLLVATLAVVLIGKPLVALVLVRLLRYPLRVALGVAVALAQIGEFSFILSSIGRTLGILTNEATNTLVMVSIVSIVLNPIIYRGIVRFERSAIVRSRLWKALDPPIIDTGGAQLKAPRPDPRLRAVVVGFGPTGRTVTRLLRENGVEPVVIELNVETVRRLRQDDVAAIYGDALQPTTLEAAGVQNAASLILTSAGMGDSAEVIRAARALNPRIRVFARAAYLRDLPELRDAGADAVFTGEGEVALALTEAILHRLGATPEQIDRERHRAHSELFGESAADPAEGPAVDVRRVV